MKHFIKQAFLARAAITLLLVVAAVTQASAAVDFLGNSAINVNGTWYYAGNSGMTWCTGGAFHNTNLGIFANTLPLGGQSQTWETGNKDWGSGTVIMYYKIDEGEVEHIDLTYYQFADNNNYFQSGGSNFATTNVDISSLTNGDHTLAVWFNCGDKWDSNSDANYVATFTVDSEHPNIGTIQWNTDGFYEINAESDLHDLAVYVNGEGNYYTGAAETSKHSCYNLTFKQTANITMTKEHTAIGKNDSHAFGGIYDGNSMTISGLYINKNDKEYQGLFGYIGGSTTTCIIRNVVIVDCDITGAKCTGGIVGESRFASIYSCTVSGAIKISGTSTYTSYNYHGGIVGYSEYCNIENCINTASVTGYGNWHGGIAGQAHNQYRLSNNFCTGIVEGTYNVGAIAGQVVFSSDNYKLINNYHLSTTTGGIGTNSIQYEGIGIDRDGAELVVKISADEGVSITYPDTPDYVWNEENLYKNGTVLTLDYEVPEGKVFDHYTVSNGDISNRGIRGGEHTLTGLTNDVTITGSYADNMINLEDGNGDIAAIAELTFNGKAQQPLPKVTYNGVTLVKDDNYIVTYSGDCIDAGTYTITVTGTGRYQGTLTEDFTIKKFDISGNGAVTISCIYPEYEQCGSAIHPVPIINCTATNTTLVEDTNYDVTYSEGCTLPGDYELTITAKGNYTGTIVFPFTILNDFGLTVHDGTKFNGYVPVYDARYYNKCEMVMPISDLSVLNGKVITSMKFYLKTKLSNNWGSARFRVFMKEVDFTSFASSNNSYKGTDGATIVYEGELDCTKNVMKITFTKPYIYNGGNLLIGIYQYEKGSTSSSVSLYGENVSGACISGYNYSSLDNVAVNQRGFLPKTTFIYEEPISITFAPEGYATYYDSQYDLVLPAGMKARIVTAKGTEEGKLTYKTIADGDTDNKIVPAGTAVMLQIAKGTDEQTIGVPFSKGATPTAETNLLFGSDTDVEETTGGAKYYKLSYSNNNDNFGWYWGAANGAAFSSPAHRAWLALPATAAPFLGLPDYGDGETTGIVSIDNGQLIMDNDAWYTLDGRCVANGQLKIDNGQLPKGIYIHNGKKVVIK